MKKWFVYMVRCRDNSLYTGISVDIEQRVKNHNHPRKGAKYTRKRQPVTLVWWIPSESHSQALRLERAIKKLRKTQKEQIITGNFDPCSLL